MYNCITFTNGTGCVKKDKSHWLPHSHWFELDVFGVTGLIVLIEAWRQ